MRYCDLTFAYTPTSGGIRTFIDQKRRYLTEDRSTEHILIVPGASDGVERSGRCTTYTIASPFIPGCEPYRMFVKPAALTAALRDAAPDVIELATFFLEPSAAFKYRAEAAKAGRRCVVGGYFHTDLADAYFGAPVRSFMRSQFGRVSSSLGKIAARLGNWTQRRATQYFGTVFRRCDLMCAATPRQVNRLTEYGVRGAHLVPLGVDAERFNPARRSSSVRSRLGADEAATVLVFAGRFDREKQVHVLLNAYEQLQLPGASLWLVGEGPERAEVERRAGALPGVRVLPFEPDPDSLAEVLASADIYVTAGPHETFGLSILEGQAAGLPVVGVAAGALIERVVDGAGLLGPVGDPHAFARNIERVAARAREMGAASRRHVIEQRLDWHGTFAKWHHAYRGMMSHAQRSDHRDAGVLSAG